MPTGNMGVCKLWKSGSFYTGATGLVGSRLVSRLASLGHSVLILTRNAGKAQSKLAFGKVKSLEPPEWDKGIAGADAVINLAGKLPSLQGYL